MVIGDRVKTLREVKDLSQGDIEKRTGLPHRGLGLTQFGHPIRVDQVADQSNTAGLRDLTVPSEKSLSCNKISHMVRTDGLREVLRTAFRFSGDKKSSHLSDVSNSACAALAEYHFHEGYYPESRTRPCRATW